MACDLYKISQSHKARSLTALSLLNAANEGCDVWAARYCLLKTKVESVVPRGLSLWRLTVKVFPSPDRDSLSVEVDLNSLPLKFPARIDNSSNVEPSPDQVAFIVDVLPFWPC